MSETKKLFAVLEYLESLSKNKSSSIKSTDALTTAIKALEEASGLSLADDAQRDDLHTEGFIKLAGTGYALPPSFVEKIGFTDTSLEGRFLAYLAQLKKSPVLSEKDPSSEEYAKILTMARIKFFNRNAIVEPILKPAPSPEPVAAEPELSPEEYKTKGNDRYKGGDYEAAAVYYSRAISADPKKAVYYSNRAAANIKLKRYSKVIDDCKTAIEIDPLYIKAYNRLGFAYMEQQKYQQALDEAFLVAAEIDPTNTSLAAEIEKARFKLAEAKKQEKIAKEMGELGGATSLPGIAPDAAMAAAAPMAEMFAKDPKMAEAAGAALGQAMRTGDFRSMMENPAMRNIASQMMSNPAMSSMMQNPQFMEMAQKMMSDPSQMAEMMKNFGGMGMPPPEKEG